MAALQYVWVVLVQSGYPPSAQTMLVAKPELGPWVIDAVKTAATLKFAAELQGLSAHRLEVRETIDGPALEPSGAAQQMASPLFIVDPRPVTTSGSTCELFTVWSILISSSKIFIFRNAWPALL